VDIGVTADENTLTAKAQDAQYAWLDCDDNQVVSGADSKSFTAQKKGRYAVIVTRDNCTDTSECYLVEPLNIGENELTGWLVYPNPSAVGYIVIASSEGGTKAQGELLNLLGERVQQFVWVGESIKLDVSYLPKGQYLLRIGGHMATVQVR
jgi:hypothetical protein